MVRALPFGFRPGCSFRARMIPGDQDSRTACVYLNIPGSKVSQRGALCERTNPEDPVLAWGAGELPELGAAAFVAAVAVGLWVATSALVRTVGFVVSS